ncbi:MAG: tryptophan synthase beta subunit-like PLP-dependent enzyme [Lasallia pustulata]|uniref:L-serine ammonia-lyase n=1 Tax=Lasallia pustulata TaxID=136370 RepID=A0A5M8PEB9_9LECA|nr:MAG: tryptophan synthase beta subunit-like PLP-dependent enzyme [Lasallia pustulata]
MDLNSPNRIRGPLQSRRLPNLPQTRKPPTRRLLQIPRHRQPPPPAQRRPGLHHRRALALLPATIVVPDSTPAFMIAKLRAAGATAVLQQGASWAEADAYLREQVLAGREDAVYVPPFDHADIWEGVGGMVEEIREQLEGGGRTRWFVRLGGGAVLWGYGRVGEGGVGGVRVLAVETRGAESLARSLREGRVVELEKITSFATGLGARRVADRAFEYARRGNVRSVVLEDAEAAMGCWRLADDERMLVEAACGVSVAVCYDGRLRKLVPELTAQSKVVVVVCGGSNISVEMLARYRKEYGYIEKVTTNDETVPSTVSAPDALADGK